MATALLRDLQEVLPAIDPLHVVIGDGICPNEAACKLLFGFMGDRPLTDCRLFFWRCSTHQANLVVKRAVCGPGLTRRDHPLTACCSRFFRHLLCIPERHLRPTTASSADGITLIREGLSPADPKGRISRRRRHMNIRSLALAQAPHLFPQAQGRLWWQTEVGRRDAKMMRTGTPAPGRSVALNVHSFSCPATPKSSHKWQAAQQGKAEWMDGSRTLRTECSFRRGCTVASIRFIRTMVGPTVMTVVATANSHCKLARFHLWL